MTHSEPCPEMLADGSCPPLDPNASPRLLITITAAVHRRWADRRLR
jgi:hypothetical protein